MDLRQEPESEIEDQYLLVLAGSVSVSFTGSCLGSFIAHFKTTYLKMVPPTVEWAHLHELIR